MTSNLVRKLQMRKHLGNLRTLKPTSSFIDFSSNDYLGLARSSQLMKAVFLEWELHKSHLLGSTGSRLLTGNSSYAEKLEEKIVNFHGYEAGLLFNSGYMANVGLLSAIASKESVFIFDAHVHASTHDGIRLSGAKAFPFKHNDLAHLEKRLKNSTSSKERFICIESIYSTDGSRAPLVEFSHLARKYQAHLIVDEAHAVGVCGPQGKGLVAENHLTSDVFAGIITFGKALGTYGAMVLGNNTLKHALINFANSYIYTTALPLQVLAAIKCSYEIFPKMDQERLYLQKLIRTFHKFFPDASPSHIQSIIIKGNENVKKISKSLQHAGFDVRPLLSPTVRKGHEMLRISLHAYNKEIELEELIQKIRECHA